MVLMCNNTMPTSEEFTGKMPTDSINRPKSLEGRKSSKPLMEKRRRARINDSLGQLKTLILEATNQDTARHSKLEKADILEMTVKYLKNLQRHHIVASVDSEVNATRYRLGYSECISEVSRYLSPMDTNLVDLRVQLLNHLASSCTPNQSQPQIVTNNNPVSSPSPVVAVSPVTPHIPQPLQIQVAPSSGNGTIQTVPITVTAALPQNAAIAIPSATPIQMKNEVPSSNNSHQQQSQSALQQGATRLVSSIQVGLPSGISGGEIALVLPPQAFANGQIPSHFIPVYSQQASVVSPTCASTAAISQDLSSPVGTATASLAQLPLNTATGYQTQQIHNVDGCMTTTTSANIPSRNVVSIQYSRPDVTISTDTKMVSHIPPVTCTSNIVSLPAQTLVSLRSPLQTSHRQNQHILPPKSIKFNSKCIQEVVAMEDDNSCWRPWQRI